MFRKIRGVFGSKGVEQGKSTSRGNDIDRLIMIHKRRLAALEKKKANAGSDPPPMIVAEIEEIRQEIAKLEGKLEEPEESPFSQMPDKLRQLYESAEDTLDSFRTAFETATTELDYMPEESRPGAAQLVDIGKSQLLELEEEWDELCQSPIESEDILRDFIEDVVAERGELSILVQRAIHRGNLGILEKQLALRQSALTKDELERTLRPQMDFELEKITTLEEKNRLDADEQERLAIHRNNLEIYQEMLSGQRPYAPLDLVNQVAVQEQDIQELDNRLVR